MLKSREDANGQLLAYYDDATFETIAAFAPVRWRSDFLPLAVGMPQILGC